MPSRRRGRRSHWRNRASDSALPSCNLPKDIIANILSRLPVKSLLGFRCVCKPWRTLISSPTFISMHLHRTTLKPNNHSFIVHSIHNQSSDHIISLFHTHSTPFPTNLDHPFPFFFLKMDVVGSFNGVVCLCHPPWGDVISLWNPATKQVKGVRLSGTKPIPTINDKVSIGFGFDPVGNDYKIISILCFKPELKVPARVEVYSPNADSWGKIKVDPPFHFLQTTCAAVVKGTPYWMVSEDELGFREVFVSFDVQNEVFHYVPVPKFPGHSGTRVRLVDLKNSLAVIVYSPSEESNKCVDVWMMDDEGWSKKFTVGPILVVERLLGCLKNGEIVAENAQGKLFLYDPETKGIKYLHIGGARARSFEVFNYMESLVSIKGATRVEEKDFKIEESRETLSRFGIHMKVRSESDGRVYLDI